MPRLGAWTGYLPGFYGFGGNEDSFEVTMSIDGEFEYAPTLKSTPHPIFSSWTHVQSYGSSGGYVALFSLGVAPDGSVSAQCAVTVGYEVINTLEARSPAGTVGPTTGAFTLRGEINAYHGLSLKLMPPRNGLASTISAVYEYTNEVQSSPYATSVSWNGNPSAVGVFANDGGVTRVVATVYEAMVDVEGSGPIAWFFDDGSLDPSVPAFVMRTVDPLAGTWEWVQNSSQAGLPLSEVNNDFTVDGSYSAFDLSVAKIPVSVTPNGDPPYSLNGSYLFTNKTAYRKLTPNRPTYRPISGIEESA